MVINIVEECLHPALLEATDRFTTGVGVQLLFEARDGVLAEWAEQKGEKEADNGHKRKQKKEKSWIQESNNGPARDKKKNGPQTDKGHNGPDSRIQ